jgi:hypothetical protein
VGGQAGDTAMHTDTRHNGVCWVALFRCVVLAAVAAAMLFVPAAASPPAHRSGDSTISLLFAGDVMLGRGVAQAAADPANILAGARAELTAADLAVANLESPLTERAHDPAFGPNALEARPAGALLLAAAGFDAFGIANNHAGDAGPRTVIDTLGALSRARIVAVGGGPTAAVAYEPRLVEVHGVRVALLAFDATGVGPRAGVATPGIASWNETAVRKAVQRARAEADVVAVGIHGGTEYVTAPDPSIMAHARQLASWGADIVWGQGPHVAQPVRVIRARVDGRPTVVASSLGNLVFGHATWVAARDPRWQRRRAGFPDRGRAREHSGAVPRLAAATRRRGRTRRRVVDACTTGHTGRDEALEPAPRLRG